jgi:hypothetical protein
MNLVLGQNAERMVFILQRNTYSQAAENSDKQNYSGLTSQQLQSIYSANNLRCAGTIEYGKPAELLYNVQIDQSFFTQLKVLLRSIARAVSRFFDRLAYRRKPVADFTSVCTL